MKKLFLVVALTASAGLIYWLASPPSPQMEAAGSKKAAALSGLNLKGETVTLSQFAGQVVLVDFWATWCDPCKEEIPDLVKLYGKLKSPGFVILGDSMDEEGASAVKKFLEKQAIPYPVILNGGERPPAGWTVPGLPTAYLIGRDGMVVKRWFGSKDSAELEAAVVEALKH